MIANHVKALLHKNGCHWNTGGSVGNSSGFGGSAAITYSFMDGRPAGFDPDQFQDFADFSATQASWIEHAMDHYEEIANITFAEVASGGDIDWGYAQTFYDWDGDGVIESHEVAGGLATRPYSNGSIIVIDRDSTNFSQGSWGYLVLMHELGHAAAGFNDVTIGLNFSETYTTSQEYWNQGIDGQVLSVSEDSRKYTAMSYNNHPDMPGVHPNTLLLYDIAALQTLYGANTSTRAGNTTYSWATNETFLETIWDGGGTDTISASNQTRDAVINLNPGTFSSIGSYAGRDATDNLAIAFNVTIENAYGGSGNDRVFGNAVGNEIRGGAGNDRLFGQDGNDRLFGEDGNDRLFGQDGNDFLYGQDGNDFLYGQDGDDFLYGHDDTDRLSGEDGNDRLYGQEGNDFLYGGNGDDFLYGQEGNDFLYGGNGDDRQSGGKGDDRLYGENGNDFLYGENGNDSLYGGKGDDRLYGKDGNDSLYGWQGNDRLYGENGNDSLYGENGNDSLYGGKGSDVLIGGAGADTLVGFGSSSSQFDTLTGGAGTDTFVLGDLGSVFYLGSGHARITDFTSGSLAIEDTIQIRGVLNDYTLNQSVNYGGAAALDTAIFLGSDLIGVVEDTTAIALTADYFTTV
ncbi:peptidase M10 serralysin [Rubidibacter lacunae KORDI 51-2]|uniref:Peptidase M10 serralysin n=1 Tax=Rubidibacter lacunae KORDI 51-2 TaxID=582515 RepID=U5DAV6_9CHRO|nr:M10 family metallopeptidase C-terminal domain-containing protein [Rubidibacter lacunae]ERN41683.1 peptidase M10 serralysin [Rubidibacter lacunae KORDI 51-2]